MQLISIERVVAFVLGPPLVAGAGLLSGYLAKVGVTADPAAITTAIGTGAAGTAGLIYRWLKGRSEWASLQREFGPVTKLVDQYTTAEQRASLLGDIEKLVDRVVAGHVKGGDGANLPTEPSIAIGPAPNDPAPATPIPPDPSAASAPAASTAAQETAPQS